MKKLSNTESELEKSVAYKKSAYSISRKVQVFLRHSERKLAAKITFIWLANAVFNCNLFLLQFIISKSLISLKPALVKTKPKQNLSLYG